MLDFDKGGGRLKILAIPGPTKDEALAFLELEGLLRASDDPATRAKLARVAELVGDRYMQAKSDATTARGVAVTEQGACVLPSRHIQRPAIAS